MLRTCVGICVYIPKPTYTNAYKFSRGAGFSWFYFRGSFVINLRMIVLKIFEDLIFVHDKLPVKTAKIMSLENLYTYGTDMFIGI